HETLADERGSASARARLRAARGRLEAARGDLEAARMAFGEALELLEGLPLRYDRARIEFVHGQVLRRAGKRKEADEVFRSARETFAALGAATYVERCDRETKAGGVRAPRADRDPGELTPQEQAVSRLVAQGMTNREVAAELYLSTKTVQFHLTRVYGKPGVRSRAALAAWLGGPHGPPGRPGRGGAGRDEPLVDPAVGRSRVAVTGEVQVHPRRGRSPGCSRCRPGHRAART